MSFNVGVIMGAWRHGKEIELLTGKKWVNVLCYIISKQAASCYRVCISITWLVFLSYFIHTEYRLW